VISRLRFEHHAALINAGCPLDNLIDPDELPPIARRELRDALASVKRGQKRIGPSA
jgi:signal-transduction protein with cAMP-binding, CBS, and nucleotidyltransferase domain